MAFFFYSESRLYSFKDSIKVFALIKTDFIKVQKIQSFRLKHERFGRLDGTRSSDAVSTSSSSNPMMMLLSTSALLFRLFQRCFNAETGAGNSRRSYLILTTGPPTRYLTARQMTFRRYLVELMRLKVQDIHVSSASSPSEARSEQLRWCK